jgi:hypothetical protein
MLESSQSTPRFVTLKYCCYFMRFSERNEPSVPIFWPGPTVDHGDPEMLVFSMTRFFKFLPQEQRQAFLEGLSEKAS